MLVYLAERCLARYGTGYTNFDFVRSNNTISRTFDAIPDCSAQNPGASEILDFC